MGFREQGRHARASSRQFDSGADGTGVGEGRIEQTEPIGYGAVYTDVGRTSLSPVTDDYTPGDTEFTGIIKWIQLESGDDSHDHLIDPEMVIHAAMYRQ